MLGLPLVGQVIHFTYVDDQVGGAVPSGTVTYAPVYARLAPNKPTLALLEQGLETPTIFTGLFYPQVEMVHNDQFQVTSPPTSHYFNQKFRIIGVVRSSIEGRRKYLVGTLRRIEEAVSNDLQ